MRVVLAHGTFDLLHLGHTRLFAAARKLGDILVVSVTADRFVNKGPGRPIYNEHERAEMVRNVRCVDYVEIAHESTGVGMIRKLRPAIYAKGIDYLHADKNGALEQEKAAVEEYGGRLVLLDAAHIPSSELIERVAKWSEPMQLGTARYPQDNAKKYGAFINTGTATL